MAKVNKKPSLRELLTNIASSLEQLISQQIEKQEAALEKELPTADDAPPAMESVELPPTEPETVEHEPREVSTEPPALDAPEFPEDVFTRPIDIVSERGPTFEESTVRMPDRPTDETFRDVAVELPEQLDPPSHPETIRLPRPEEPPPEEPSESPQIDPPGFGAAPIIPLQPFEQMLDPEIAAGIEPYGARQDEENEQLPLAERDPFRQNLEADDEWKLWQHRHNQAIHTTTRRAIDDLADDHRALEETRYRFEMSRQPLGDIGI